jgi:hypothetical protein
MNFQPFWLNVRKENMYTIIVTDFLTNNLVINDTCDLNIIISDKSENTVEVSDAG